MRATRHILLGTLGVFWILPVYFVLINAAKSTEEYATLPLWAPPAHFSFFSNLLSAWTAGDLGGSMISSALYAGGGGAAAVAIAALAAFAIVGLKVRHGFAWFMVIYAGTLFPAQMLIVPLYKAYVGVGLYDTRIGLALFYTAIAIPFAMFVLRNHFSTIPGELVEAARIDRAHNWEIFRVIYVPLSWSAFAAVFVFQFTWIWNDLLFGLTLSQSGGVRPVMTALATLSGSGGGGSASMPTLLAGALAVSVPTLALFLFLQRFFVAALSVVGGKNE